jgi:lambda repressor-like predicted transcriptional regulator
MKEKLTTSNILFKKTSWTLVSLSKETDISLSTLKRIFYGYADITLSHMIAIGRALHLSPNVLWPELNIDDYLIDSLDNEKYSKFLRILTKEDLDNFLGIDKIMNSDIIIKYKAMNVNSDLMFKYKIYKSCSSKKKDALHIIFNDSIK